MIGRGPADQGAGSSSRRLRPAARRRSRGWLVLLVGCVLCAAAGAVLIVVGLRQNHARTGAPAPLPPSAFSVSDAPDPVAGTALPRLITPGADDGTVLPAEHPATGPVGLPAAPATPAGSRRGDGEPPAPTAAGASRPGDAPSTRAGSAGDGQATIATDHLMIPALGVNAAVQSNPLAADGGLVLPTDVNRVTRWSGGAALAGTTGTVLVAGHVDSRSQGIGALYYLYSLRPGDLVYLSDGQRITRWKIVALTSISKADLPQWVWSGPGGQRRLAIVTCGGTFDPATRHYENNVIATAVPF